MLGATMTRLIGFLAILILLSRLALTAPSAPPAPEPIAPSCASVVSELTPCLDFIKGGSTSDPSTSCCSGVSDMSNNAKTKEDRQAICECIKKALGTVGNYDPARISQLPGKCHVATKMPPIDKNFDCSKAYVV